MSFKEVRARQQRQGDEKRRAIYKSVGKDYDKTLAKIRSEQKSRQSRKTSAEKIEKAKKEVSVVSVKREATPPKANIKQEQSERQFREQESKQAETWDWQQQMAKRYIEKNPNMPSKKFFVPIRDKEGKIIGYSDTLAKKSVILKKDETVTEESLEKANRTATALVNFSKSKEASKLEREDPNRFGGSEIGATEVPGGLAGSHYGIDKARQKVESSSSRLLGGLAGLGLGVASSILDTARFVEAIATRPEEVVKAVGTSVSVFVKDPVGKTFAAGGGIGEVLRSEPGFASGYVIGEVGQAFIGGAIIKSVEKAGINILTRLDPRYKSIIVDPDSPYGKAVLLNADTGKKIQLASGVSSTAESLTEQAKLAGTTVDGVSAQRGLFKRGQKEVLIDKPKPNPSSPDLETSFFFDPKSRLRTTRLGIDGEKAATPLDLLSGDVRFTREPAQAIYNPNLDIEAFPKSLFIIERKLKSGQPLSGREAGLLSAFQQTPSGKAKPIGFLSPESEVTLPKGEILKKEGIAGVTLIKGRRVTIIETSVKGGASVAPVISTVSDRFGVGFTRVGSSNIPFSGSYIDSTIPYQSPIASAVTIALLARGFVDTSKLSSEPVSSSFDYSKGVSPAISSSPVSSPVVSEPSPSPSTEPSIVPSGSPVVSPRKSGRGSRKPSPSTKPSIVPSGSPSPSPSTEPSIVPSGSPSPSSPPPFIPNIFIRPTPKGKIKEKRSFGSLFSPQVRKRGRWVTVDPGFGFSRSEALHKGLSVVGTSARASTRIVESKLGSKKKRFFGRGIIADFYKKGGVFIEKRGRRIKSRGELEEITYAGQRAIKAKSIMSKMKLWGK